jgi:hypothetical protein
VLATVLPQLVNPGTTVAVRVNPEDHSEIALSLGEAPPTITVSSTSGDANTGSASEILSYGDPCRVVIVESQPLGRKNQKGVDIYALLMTVMVDGRPPYQVLVGNPVPPEAVPLLYPGNNVPAKCMLSRGDSSSMLRTCSSSKSWTSGPERSSSRMSMRPRGIEAADSGSLQMRRGVSPECPARQAAQGA